MEENKDISQIVLDRIKESGIKPISKNIFNIKRVIFWSLVGFSILVGAMAFSVMLGILFNNDWYLFNKFGFGYILRTLPYFWLICLILFLFLGEFYYRKTLVGYRRSFLMIICIYILSTVIVGLIFTLLGVGEKFEQSLFKNVPVYRGVIFDRNDLWSHPEQGLISGEVIENNGSVIKIIDLNNIIHIINIDNVPISGQALIRMGQRIKIIGDNDDIFNADEIH